MLHRVFLIACILAMAQAQGHRVWYNSADECKNELCWQCGFPFQINRSPHTHHIIITSLRYLIPFWLVAVLLIVVAVCCKLMYAM
jgi:hypothetical protein